jgi:hypothetical protein
MTTEQTAPDDAATKLEFAIPTVYLSYLVEHAINTVDVNHEPGDSPCCSNCCGPCGAVMALAETGELDQILAERGPGYSWWHPAENAVDRDYLAMRIRPYCEMGNMSAPERCTDPQPDDDEPPVPSAVSPEAPNAR